MQSNAPRWRRALPWTGVDCARLHTAPRSRRSGSQAEPESYDPSRAFAWPVSSKLGPGAMVTLAALLLAVAPDVNVELELGGGFAHPLQGSPDTSGGYPFAAPALQSRVAVDFSDQLSCGAMFLAVVGGEAPNRIFASFNTPGPKAFKATSLLSSLRVHSPGSLQYWVEGGLGVGHLISLSTENAFEHAPLRGHAGLSGRMAAG